MSWSLRSAVFFAVTTVSLGANAFSMQVEDDDNFRPDVIACEEAVEKLVECCPDLPARAIDCRYLHRRDEWSVGCTSSGSYDEYSYPALNQTESACIKESSCQALIGARVCERARVATPYVDSDKTPSIHGGPPPPDMRDPQSHPPVCP
jgi:hypothetical protein